MTRFSPSTRRALRFGAVVLGLLFLSACAGDAELDTRSNLQGPEAQDIESFLRWVLWIAYAVFFAVLGVTLYAWKNFRVKGEYEEGDWPEQIHGNNTLEYAWTAAPALLLAVIGVFTIGLHLYPPIPTSRMSLATPQDSPLDALSSLIHSLTTLFEGDEKATAAVAANRNELPTGLKAKSKAFRGEEATVEWVGFVIVEVDHAE